VTCVDSAQRLTRQFVVEDYDLARTLDSGQAFRWRRHEDGWTGVVGNHWVFLQQSETGIDARIAAATTNWRWLVDYLQLSVNLNEVLSQFPIHPLIQQAITQHRGLRLLRQDPWECLASFILSSTKQIAHIKQIVENLCLCHGKPLQHLNGFQAAYSFPSPNRIAGLTESELRSFRMGFRAPYLLCAAEQVASGRLNLEQLRERTLTEARMALMSLPGVGRKIADCVLLFALGFDRAFPVDVWVMRCLQSGWFSDKQIPLQRLVEFSESKFGTYAGYVQQYLFHPPRKLKAGSNTRSPDENQGQCSPDAC